MSRPTELLHLADACRREFAARVTATDQARHAVALTGQLAGDAALP